MSGGGGNTTTVQKSDPPAYIQSFLTDIAQSAYRNSQSPPAFYPGPTFLGPTQGQLDAYGQQFDYTDSVFGGAQAPKFGEATNALSQNLTGTNGLGQLASGVSPLATQGLQQGFSGGPTNLSTASGFNTTAAFNRALSGTPDYAGLQGSIDAANAPILRQFNEEFLPQLNQRATFLGNPTGGIKALNKVLPQLGQQLGENALRATEAERQRALGEQSQTAQFLTGAGLNNQDAYRSQLLGLGGLAQGLQGQVANNQLQGVAGFGNLSALGASPGQLSAQFADFGRGFQQQALDDQIARFNYYQGLPGQALQNYSGIINGFAGLGNVQTGMLPPGNRAGGALGGAIAGAGTGAAFGPYGALIGGAIGGLGGYFAS